MLAIRMQRTGRKGHAMFRVVVQDSRLTPTSGKVVALLGSYDPHAKSAQLDTEKASFYLGHGAQPSDRVVRLLQSQGVKLPDWVKLPATDKQRVIRNSDKLRKNQPKKEEPKAPEAEAEPKAAEVTAEAPDALAESAKPAETPAKATETKDKDTTTKEEA